MKEEKNKEEYGAGLDVGTMNFVAARRLGKNVKTSRLRNAFLDLPQEHKRMLKLSKTGYIDYDGRLLVIGDEAIDTANLLNQEARRPMSSGIIASGEIDARGVMAVIIGHLLGEPKHEKEQCCFSLPAQAVDNNDSDTTYHKAVLSKILEELGYTPNAINEALAVIYSECVSDGFSGLSMSFGSGMTNVCLAYNAMSAMEFSLSRGGDWIDKGSSKSIGMTSAKMCMIKENGVDISEPKNREEEAISLYTQVLIDYSIDSIVSHFVKARKEILIPKPIPIIISGGTSMSKGFVETFKKRFEKYVDKFPIGISEIRHAKDPMTSVASGLLLCAQMED